MEQIEAVMNVAEQGISLKWSKCKSIQVKTGLKVFFQKFGVIFGNLKAL